MPTTPSTSTSPSTHSGSRARFVLFGDSITQQGFFDQEGGGAGWCARLADSYARTADVVLRGFSGYNTEWARSTLLPRVFGGGKKASLVTVFFGANDASLPDRLAERQHVPLSRFKENLKIIIEASVDATEENGLVIVITPPPIDEEARVRHALFLATQSVSPDAEKDPRLELPERTDEAARRYSEAAVDVVREFQKSSSSSSNSTVKVEVLDLHSAFKKDASSSSPWRDLLSDGLHLNARGNEKLFVLLLEFISERAPHLLPENLPSDYPLHSEMEPCAR